MSNKPSGIDRRDFFRHSVGVGAGAFALGHLPDGIADPPKRPAGPPFIITSHSIPDGSSLQ